MNYIDHPQLRKLQKSFTNFTLTASLMATLGACGSGEYNKPSQERPGDTQLISKKQNDGSFWSKVLHGNHGYRLVKHRGDTGSPYHLVDQNGNLVIQEDLDSFVEVEVGLYSVDYIQGVGLYSIDQTKYLRKLDNGYKINKILARIYAGYTTSGIELYDVSTNKTLSVDSNIEVLSDTQFIAKNHGTYTVYDDKLGVVYKSGSESYARRGNYIDFEVPNASGGIEQITINIADASTFR